MTCHKLDEQFTNEYRTEKQPGSKKAIQAACIYVLSGSGTYHGGWIIQRTQEYPSGSFVYVNKAFSGYG